MSATVLHVRYFDRFLYALNGGNLSLSRQICFFLRVLRVLRSSLFGFKLMFLSPPILVEPVPGMNDFLCLLLVSNFKLELELFYDGCASHRNAVILRTVLILDLRLVNFVLVSVVLGRRRDGNLVGSASELGMSRHVQAIVSVNA